MKSLQVQPPTWQCSVANMNITPSKASVPQNVTTQQEQCLGVVLSGGLSSRMGTNKAKLLRNNVEMLSFSKQLLTKSGVSHVVVSGNQYDVPDLLPNLGPMAGIYSSIMQYQPKALLILPVDLPLMNVESLSNLKKIGELKQQATYYQDNFLPLYLPVNAYLELFLQKVLQSARSNTLNINKSGKASGVSMKALLKEVPSQAVKTNKPNILLNANTPEDWQQAQTLLKL